MKLKTLSVLLCFFALLRARADTISIGILGHLNIHSFVITSFEGDYQVIGDSTSVFELKKKAFLHFTIEEGRVKIKDLNKELGTFEQVCVTAQSGGGSVQVKIIDPEKPAYVYDDNLIIKIFNKGFKLINVVELENYVAGVIEAEVGTKAVPEYYKLQAIICRTYALSHLRRHEEDLDFELCDRVHCQAYKGKSRGNPAIITAALETKNIVIVDETLDLITAAFYSNCGGETANSEDVWLLSKPYLRAIRDTFCLKEPHALWKKKIPLVDWSSYLLIKYNYRDTTSGGPNFTQDHRLNEMNCYPFPISLKTLRTDWNLKSTFFSIVTENDTVYFKGHGFGHGVGMCQEGAMKMARLGYSYKDILNFYFHNVFLVTSNRIDFFKD